jgi:hypothetical protein
VAFGKVTQMDRTAVWGGGDWVASRDPKFEKKNNGLTAPLLCHSVVIPYFQRVQKHRNAV